MDIAKLILEFVRVLAWPIVAVFIAVYFRKSLQAILERLIRATLPGGVSLDFKEKIEEAQKLSQALEAPKPNQLQQASLPLTVGDVNKKLISLGLEPVSSGLDIEYFRSMAKIDPALAFAALRIEIEALTKNIIVGCNLPIQKNRSTMLSIRDLSKAKAIDGPTAILALDVLNICSRAIHGQKVYQDDAERVIDIAAFLFALFRTWLINKK
jgi:hypothetical protein